MITVTHKPTKMFKKVQRGGCNITTCNPVAPESNAPFFDTQDCGYSPAMLDST